MNEASETLRLIRQTERKAAQRIEQAKARASDVIAEARARSRELVEAGRERGRAEARRRLRAAKKQGESEAEQIRAEGAAAAGRLVRQADVEIENLVELLVDVVLAPPRERRP